MVQRAGIPTPTPKSKASLDSVLTESAVTWGRGYALDDEEQELGVRCYSVAVPDVPTPMAISVSGPSVRVDLDFGNRAVPALHAAAKRISQSVGS